MNRNLKVSASKIRFQGYLRADGRKGIRNRVLVVYLVECAHHVARQVSSAFSSDDVHLIGFPGCYPNEYAQSMLEALCTHPNVGGVLLMSLGCEEFDRTRLLNAIQDSGRPAECLVIQASGGSLETIEKGRAWVQGTRAALRCDVPRVEMGLSDLIIGTKCGGSDGLSGITANPAIGLACDSLVDVGATAIFEELGELFGCEAHMARRAVSASAGARITAVMENAKRYYSEIDHGSFGGGNITGGLSTVEEKSLGAYTKSGARPIVDVLRPAEVPAKPGLYLMNMVSDGPAQFGYPNINDTTEVVEMVACGAHIVLFSTGRGSVVGSAISPIIKICSNPDTARAMAGDMDINAGKIIEGEATLHEVGEEILDKVAQVAQGVLSVSEAMGHQEFCLTYKRFDSLDGERPRVLSCHPANRP